MANPDIKLQIEEIVLHGFPSMNNAALRQAVEKELSAMLHGNVSIVETMSTRNTAAVDAGSVRMPSGSTPEALGKIIAGAVYGGLKP